MKKYIVFFYLFFVLLVSCNNKLKPEFVEENDRCPKNDFIYLEDNVFKLNNDSIYLVMLNYIIDFRDIEGEFVLSTNFCYESDTCYEYNTKTENYEQIERHFKLIKELGFNSIRLCFDRLSKTEDGEYFIETYNKQWSLIKDYKVIIAGLNEIVQIAKKLDLKLMLLIKPPIDNPTLNAFTIEILKKFKDEPTIFAYDFFNEPLYFDNNYDRSKIDIYRIVRKWKNLIDTYAPNQLLTIGFAEPIEIFCWDASILPVDFIQIHTYHPLRVPSEIWWYSTYMNKPFMIGETSLPADNDSISYEEQRLFMIDAYKYAADCGAIGFGWWDFQENCYDNRFEARYAALLNHFGKISLKNDSIDIIGSVKPAAFELKNLKNYKKSKKPQKPVNYYNMMGYNNYCIKGKVVDNKTNKPIEGAVVRAWNNDWSIGLNSYSNKNGEFCFYSNDENVAFRVSAVGMFTVAFQKKIDYVKANDFQGDSSNLPNQKLEYHKISYQGFLSKAFSYDLQQRYPIFDFNPDLFDDYKFEANLGEIRLKKVYIPKFYLLDK